MNWTNKSFLFVLLNLFPIGWLVAILVMLLQVINGTDPLALFGILAADVAFLAVSISLIMLNKYYPIMPTIVPCHPSH